MGKRVKPKQINAKLREMEARLARGETALADEFAEGMLKTDPHLSLP